MGPLASLISVRIRQLGIGWFPGCLPSPYVSYIHGHIQEPELSYLTT